MENRELMSCNCPKLSKVGGSHSEDSAPYHQSHLISKMLLFRPFKINHVPVPSTHLYVSLEHRTHLQSFIHSGVIEQCLGGTVLGGDTEEQARCPPSWSTESRKGDTHNHTHFSRSLRNSKTSKWDSEGTHIPEKTVLVWTEFHWYSEP